MEERVLGVIETLQSKEPMWVFIFVTDKRLIVTPPPPKETLLMKGLGPLGHAGLEVTADLIREGAGGFAGGEGIDFLLNFWKGAKGREEYRVLLKKTLDTISPQQIVEASNDAMEILPDNIEQIEMTRKRMSLLRYKNSEIKITATMNGKNRKFKYQITPPVGAMPNLTKRPVTRQEFSEYAELIRSLVHDKIIIQEDPTLGD